MSISKTIGGDRLGSGNKNKVHLRNYERSTQDLSTVWTSTLAPGTLVPFLNETMLPGDTFDIELNTDIMTLPTIGPLFGSYKVQLDVFVVPYRLYNKLLHNNALNIGLKMSDVKLPQIEVVAQRISGGATASNQQINPSSLLKYLGISGIGDNIGTEEDLKREFNAVPYLAYFDIFKNYYANKQEKKAYILHNESAIADSITQATMTWEYEGGTQSVNLLTGLPVTVPMSDDTMVKIIMTDPSEAKIRNLLFEFGVGSNRRIEAVTELFEDINFDTQQMAFIITTPTPKGRTYKGQKLHDVRMRRTNETQNLPPKLTSFDLDNIDDMRESILSANKTVPFKINASSIMPYNLILEGDSVNGYSKMTALEGLLVKTYQSDIFNNWMSTEWIDGEDGINAITAVDTSSGEFSIDAITMARKIYDMLTRIAISGGSYRDWISAVYTHESMRQIESPMYVGGLSKELVFQEIVSNSQTAEQPLGTLAGRGRLSGKHKGGKLVVRTDEISVLMGIISLTPRVTYSQGNLWSNNLKTLDDFHKPALDQIGFQDLVTDNMAWFGTKANTNGAVEYRSAGKQPAWLNYMTNIDRSFGDFAIEDNSMFMTLNRRYEAGGNGTIVDMTTYIDPAKYNNIFADSSISAQNFWTQVKIDITARRKMSAKIMPNL